MKEIKPNSARPHRHTDIQRAPHRVAARLEGVVKNLGIKPDKKSPKEQK
jgi:hypothetical protein